MAERAKTGGRWDAKPGSDCVPIPKYKFEDFHMEKVTSPEQVIDFWFAEIARPLWFRSTPFDQSISEKFMGSYQAAMAGRLMDWQATAQGVLGLVIILDQFPLNMFRGQAESFASEAMARTVTRLAIDRQFDQQLTDEQKAFLYMPLMHSEDLLDQKQSVILYETTGLKDNSRFAKHHQAIIQKFGRFPHRNTILGRKSSEAELQYLQSEEAFLG